MSFGKNDLAKRWPKTVETGRNSTPVEVVLRMLVVKRLYGYSYEETVERVRDSLSLRRFCQPPGKASADRGLFSEPNEQLAQDLGGKHVILPKRGYRSKARLKHEHKAWFVKGRHGMPVWKVALVSSSVLMTSVATWHMV